MRPFFLIALLIITIVICPTASIAQDTPKPQTPSVRQVTTEATPKTVDLNGADIILPTLPGFVEVSDLLPNIRKLVEASYSQDNKCKLLALYFPTQDLPDLKDQNKFPDFDEFIVVMSPKHALISGHDFEEVKTEIKTKSDKLFSDARPGMNKQADKEAAYITNTYGVPIHLDLGEIKQLGSFHEDLNTLSSLRLENGTVTADASHANVTVAVASSLLRTNNRFVLVYVNKTYNNAIDLDWVKDISLTYTNQLLIHNPPNSPDPPTSTFPQIYLESVFKAIPLVLMFAALSIFRKKRPVKSSKDK